MTREEILQYIKSELDNNENAEIYLDVDDYKIIVDALEQKPIEKFENAKDHIFKLAGDYKCWDNRLTHDEALELCHILEQEPKWIPVSEKLPENKTYVLTTIKVPNRIAHARSGWYEGGFFHNDNGDVWRATDMEVIAWMPLPEPYKESEENER